MKFVKRLTLTLLIFGTIGFLCREWLYNQFVSYRSIGFRPTYVASNPKLINYLNSDSSKQKNPDIHQIIKQSLSITSGKLNFTTGKNSNDPNKLITSRTAHCVGYASFFSTACNYLLKKDNLSHEWIAKTHVGQLYILGTNIHRYLNSPFLKDHDFVTIENKTTGEVLAVDPTLNDYFGIDFIALSNEN